VVVGWAPVPALQLVASGARATSHRYAKARCHYGVPPQASMSHCFLRYLLAGNTEGFCYTDPLKAAGSFEMVQAGKVLLPSVKLIL